MPTEQPAKPFTQDEGLQAFIVGLLWKLADLKTPRWCPGSVILERGKKLRAGMAFRSDRHAREILVSLVDRDVIVERSGKSRIADFEKMNFRVSGWMFILLKAAKEFEKV